MHAKGCCLHSIKYTPYMLSAVDAKLRMYAASILHESLLAASSPCNSGMHPKKRAWAALSTLSKLSSNLAKY